jgi:hypothetical protein
VCGPDEPPPVDDGSHPIGANEVLLTLERVKGIEPSS